MMSMRRTKQHGGSASYRAWGHAAWCVLALAFVVASQSASPMRAVLAEVIATVESPRSLVGMGLSVLALLVLEAKHRATFECHSSREADQSS